MFVHLQRSRVGVLAFLLGAFIACGARTLDTDDGGLGTDGSTGAGGATGTTGGTSSTGAGGSGGSGGSGGTGTGGAGGTSRCGCSTSSIQWWMDGGLAPLRDVSEFHPCQTFVLTRLALTDPPGPRACKQELGDCTNALGALDVNAAVAHPDVQRAIAAAPVTYGEDTRPVDGQVMAIQFAARIEVGNPCSSATCKPIPPGVDALAKLLRNLTNQELARGACRMTFPPVP